MGRLAIKWVTINFNYQFISDILFFYLKHKFYQNQYDKIIILHD